jgi:hypothetical protein
MIEREDFINGIDPKRSAYATFWPETPVGLVDFLQLAEHTGAYAALPLDTKKALEMRYVEGLDAYQIGDVLGVSKQRIEQRIYDAPSRLYQKMTYDILNHESNIPFQRVLTTYNTCLLDLREAGIRVIDVPRGRRHWWSSQYA